MSPLLSRVGQKGSMMESLPFEQLKSITERLSDPLLANLVAVLSRTSDSQVLLVYLPERLPAALPPLMSSASLDDLATLDLSTYDGLTIAFSAIDVIRDDLPTKGLAFYPLDQLLRERNQLDLLWRTLTALSYHLFSLLQDQMEAISPARRRQIHLEVVVLGAPSVLAHIPRTDLLCLIPDQDLEAYVEEGACRAVYRQLPDPATLPRGVQACDLQQFGADDFLSKGDILIALREILKPNLTLVPADPEWKEKEFIAVELRAVLNKNGLADAIDTTVRNLALDFWRKAEQTHDEMLSQTAYALATQCWLSGRDTSGLVGILPANDLHDFLAGRAYAIYRQLPEMIDSAELGNTLLISLERFTTWTIIPSGYGRHAQTLPPLRAQVCNVLGVKKHNWLDLGPILVRAGRVLDVARSDWLLVRDLITWPTTAPTKPQINSSHLLRTVRRSCDVTSLENPWHRRQGRYNTMLASIYNTLDQVLEKMEQQYGSGPEHLYYQALQSWYACACTDSQSIRLKLEEMITHLRQFEQRIRLDHRETHPLKHAVMRLRNVGQAILFMMSRGGQPDIIRQIYPEELGPVPGGVPLAIHQAVEARDEVQVPSLLLRQGFHRYMKLMERVQSNDESQVPVDVKIEQIQLCVAELTQARRVSFALPHEQNILKLLYDQAITQAKEMIEDLRGSAHLRFDLATHTVVQHEESNLVLYLKNIGRAKATEVEVELIGSEEFNLREASSMKTLTQLLPETEARIAFTIKPVTDDTFTIPLRISYCDTRPDRQTRQHDLFVRVESLDQGRFVPKQNPYFYGAPLTGQRYRSFYGRRLELESLISHLVGGAQQHVLLRGSRRMGKTSMLFVIKLIIEDRAGASGVRRWFGIPAIWNAGLDMLQPIFIDLQSIERKADSLSPTGFYREILSQISRAGCATMSLQPVIDQTIISAQQFGMALRQAQQSARRFLLLIDEFDVVDLMTDKYFYANLRHVISTVEHVIWIITSARGLHKEVAEYESPLFNIFKIRDLAQLDRRAAEHLILDAWRDDEEEPVLGSAGLRFHDDAVEAILHETGRYPYFIQLLCSEIVEYINSAQRTNYVLRSTVYDVIDNIIAPKSAAYIHFDYLWEPVSHLERMILLSLLHVEEPPTTEELYRQVAQRLRQVGLVLTQEGLKADYSRCLAHLYVIGAIEKNNSGRLVFGIPLFRRLLNQRTQHEDLWAIVVHEFQLAMMGEKGSG